MYNDGVKLIEARGEGDSPRISLWFDRQLRDVFISLISLSFCKQLRQVISLLISLSFDREIRGVILVLISLSFCKEKIQIKEANKSPYLLTVFQGAKSK